MLGKTVVTIESVVMKLDPNFNVVTFSQPYIARLLFQQLDPQHWAKQVSSTVGDIAELACNLPLQLHQIFQKLQRGNLKFELEHLSLERLLGELDRISNRVSFSLIIAALIVGSSIVLQNVNTWEWRFFLGVMGYVTATFFGLGLVISILRSGRF